MKGSPAVRVLAAAILTAAAASSRPATAPAPYGHVELSVPGRASATPWIAAHGDTVVVAWSAQTRDGSAEIFAAVSGDAGRRFAPPVRVSDGRGTARVSGEQPPRVALSTGGSDPLTVDVLWTARDGRTSVRLARSIDGGRMFGAPAGLQTAGALGDRGWAALAVDDQGAAHAVWLDHRGLDAGGETEHRHHGQGGTAGEGHDGVAMAQKSGLYYSNGGRERPLTHGVCYCCKTAVAAHGGRLFLAWRHVYPGSLRDIAFMTSATGAAVFAEPVRVSQDQWQLDGCPDDGPAVAVESGGLVHVVWPTLVADPQPHKAVFHATTQDGRAFSRRERLSPPGRNASHPSAAASAGGDVSVLWDEIVDGTRRVFLARRRADAARFSEPVVLDGHSALYPVAAYSGDTLIAAWTEGGGDQSVIRVTRIERESGTVAAEQR